MAGTEAQSGYAPVGDLNMYYEISGDGRPTILLHGAYQTIDTIGPLLPGLAETRKVIAVEQQGHGRTADIDRPLTYEQMADDTAAAVRHLGIDDADFVGYSMGGAIALQVAIRHPTLVRKLVVASATFRSDGMPAEALAMFPRSRPSSSPGPRSRPSTSGSHPTPATSRSWSRSSSNSTRRTSPGRRRTSGRSPRPH
jgi:pimeloyl-ACP methyl ester carboxylesterase